MIPEEMMTEHLTWLLESSEPGAALHHLHVLSAPAGPLGIDYDKIKVLVAALAADDSEPVQQFIARAIIKIGLDVAEADEKVIFAGISQETWMIEGRGVKSLMQARRLHAEGKSFGEHPDACEVTALYAASADGRRWRGQRWLTGPKAGTNENVTVLVGPARPAEEGPVHCASFIRAMVGLR